MKKLITRSYRIILIILILISSIFNLPKAFSDLNLLENFPNNNILPHHFRKSTDDISTLVDNNINLTGLDKLNISGSGQFSDSGLSLIKESIPNSFNILDIDLRQESHGFINGIAVSFENLKNNANKGLTLPEILATENNLLKSIKIGEPITFYNTKETVIPENVQSELEVANSKEIGYIRIPVTDGGMPTEDMINSFINIVNNQPENTWLHFHCKEGIGRTTTFMIMYDIMKNYKEVSLNDIIRRQVLLSQMNEIDAQGFYSGKHNEFLKKFYNEYTSTNKKEAI
ncbi:dual specificity protein phosphatase family protein [Clostridium nigeriense]|uniref:fused DSP-PTPase phosphatase/NAD kinase-like protein n=1 Tax=Clostridium nigeriense TaxID=1805470 RepID=UPI000834F887|nr:dual specificity protein phosphatase family protein [Clostridium nigeriense]